MAFPKRIIRGMALITLLTMAAAESPTDPNATLRIAAFNVQVFGKSKMSKADVVPVLVRILRRYDIVAVQEVRDASQTAVPALLDAVNAAATGADGAGSDALYDVLVSDRLGATSSKEQYAWFFRPAVVSPVDSWNAAAADGDGVAVDGEFNRVPHAVRWRVGATGHTFSAFVLHADPDDAVAELHALGAAYGRYAATDGARGDVGALLFGDFNAECNYVTSTEWECIKDAECEDTAMSLYDPARFAWLLDDSHDTTTKSTDCAYDRIVATHGAMADGAVVPGSARVFRFDLEPSPLDDDLVHRVSDHYPVELRLSFGDGASTNGEDGDEDGEKDAVEPSTEPGPSPAPVEPRLVCVNTADEDELADGLHGVGPSKAAAIVADRNANGPFSSLDDVTRVSGIGAATLAGFRDQATAECGDAYNGGCAASETPCASVCAAPARACVFSGAGSTLEHACGCGGGGVGVGGGGSCVVLSDEIARCERRRGAFAWTCSDAVLAARSPCAAGETGTADGACERVCDDR